MPVVWCTCCDAIWLMVYNLHGVLLGRTVQTAATGHAPAAGIAVRGQGVEIEIEAEDREAGREDQGAGIETGDQGVGIEGPGVERETGDREVGRERREMIEKDLAVEIDVQEVERGREGGQKVEIEGAHMAVKWQRKRSRQVKRQNRNR